ncbi:Retrovirus-related Pol polyprotein from transposon RE1 [Vitis vinifera]|uniref:Retrovirus-related Pol polyprotein from transposon RE1 n=1 Tax=Vitis vinifera TaxID=29760 RepID=A0A438JR02_VITVI|nr:Retrovirus-related Pol polyprotein from transposon RE1 [Vitis vinifera]
MKCTDFLEKAKLVSDELAAVGRHPPTQLAAMVAHSNAEQEEETWFADSGANQHITANLEHLTLQQPYTGQENVAVGNGQGLSIAHTGYSSHQNGYRCLDPVTQKVLISRHVVFNENTFPAKDGLQSSELLPVVSSQDSPDSPLESLPIPTSPHISILPSPIPGSAPFLSIPEVSFSSNHSHHPMTTRSQTGNLKPHTFSDFKLYSTQYPLQALSSTVTPLAPTSYRKAALLPDWCVAMREEYDALLANETWKLCPRPVDHNVVGNKWVYKVKQTSIGEVDRFKARLVALGFAQEEGIDFTETFSPVIKPSTVRVLLTLSVQFDWEIRQLDVSNAFLHGILLEDVYMEQPKGFVNSDFPDYVCKLNKSLYGLKQTPCAWFMRLSQTLLEFGFLSSPVDASLFVYHKGHIHLFILIYVDDILVIDTDPSLIQSLIKSYKPSSR